MNPKTRNLTGWILTGLIAFVFIASAFMKLFGNEAEMQKNASGFGLSLATIKELGVLELICIGLFIYPRTSIVGTLLIAAYMGGAIATHLQHQMPLVTPVIIETVIFITAAVRFPELSKRLMGN